MKWDIIKSTWEYREPKFWSKCNFFHHHRNGLYEPDDKNCICLDCHTWWAKGIKREETYYPNMFIGKEEKTGKGIINTPFWYIEGEAGVKKNPLYTTEHGWLNGRGVALMRERKFAPGR
jgi:hypothetical protein